MMQTLISKSINAITVVAFCFLTGTSFAGEKVLKLASFVPPIYVLHKPIFLKFAEDLSAATNGSVSVKVYPSGELGKGPAEQYMRAVKRIAEITYGLPGYTSPMFPRNLLIELPGVTNGHRDATEKIWKVMDKHLIGEYKRTRPLAVFVTPPAVFMMRDKPIRTLSDLKGLKIRVASKSAASVIEAYGATPVQMPANKVYTSMSTGVVDGALMGSDSLLIFKLIEPSKFVTIGIPEMPTTIFLVMNENAYNELSSSEKSALNSVTGLGMSLRAADGLAGFGKFALKKFAGIPGKEIIELSAAEQEKFNTAAAQGVKNIIRYQKSKGIPADKILAAMKN